MAGDKAAHVAVSVEGKLPDVAEIDAVFVWAFDGMHVVMCEMFGRGWEAPGAPMMMGETPDEAAHRILFDSAGATPLLAGPLGYETHTFETQTPPEGWGFSFPVANFAFYWAVVEELGTPSESMAVGQAHTLTYEKAKKTPFAQRHSALFDAAWARACAVQEALQNSA